MYWLSVTLVHTEYLNSRSTDPLAMLHALTPFCYIIIMLFAVLCFTCVLYELGNRCIHILLLIQFSLMLWFAPYYLSGFSRITDSLWHVGIAKHLPDIERGHQMMFSHYYKEYPTSYILNYVVMQISGIDAFIYARLIYPLFCIIGIVLLWYIFVSRLFTYKIAFISALIAILGPEPPEVHISPHSLGTLLVLVSAILLVTCRSTKSKIIVLLLTFTLITVHPISPLILLVFLIAPHIVKVFVPNVKPPYLRSGIVATFCGWFSWALFYATRTETHIAESIYNIVTLNFSMQLFGVSFGTKATHTVGHVFPEFFLICTIMDRSYIIIPLIFFSRSIIGINLRKGVKKLFLQIGERVHYEKLLMLSIAFLCLILSFASVCSGVAQLPHYLWERSFFYFILAVSAYVGSNVLIERVHPSRKTWTYTKVLTISWLFFVALAYPIKSNTQDEAFQIYPPSEDNGMRFLQSAVQLSGKTLSMFLPKQFASYVDPETRFNYHTTEYRMKFLSILPLNNRSSPLPDIMVFRRTEYFCASYIYDKSFENNRYIQAITWIEGSCEFNKIYSGPTFETYVKFSEGA